MAENNAKIRERFLVDFVLQEDGHSEKKSYRLSFLVEHIRTVEFFSVSRKKSILLRQRTTLE